jgi:predicted transcriptional regulator
MAKKKEVLYVELAADLKKRLTGLAERRHRKITAEAIIAIQQYVDREEAKEAREAEEEA